MEENNILIHSNYDKEEIVPVKQFYSILKKNEYNQKPTKIVFSKYQTNIDNHEIFLSETTTCDGTNKISSIFTNLVIQWIHDFPMVRDFFKLHGHHWKRLSSYISWEKYIIYILERLELEKNILLWKNNGKHIVISKDKHYKLIYHLLDNWKFFLQVNEYL